MSAFITWGFSLASRLRPRVDQIAGAQRLEEGHTRRHRKRQYGQDDQQFGASARIMPRAPNANGSRSDYERDGQPQSYHRRGENVRHQGRSPRRARIGLHGKYGRVWEFRVFPVCPEGDAHRDTRTKPLPPPAVGGQAMRTATPATRELFGVRIADAIASSANLSRRGAYCFTLVRTWLSKGEHVCFIGLTRARRIIGRTIRGSDWQKHRGGRRSNPVRLAASSPPTVRTRRPPISRRRPAPTTGRPSTRERTATRPIWSASRARSSRRSGIAWPSGKAGAPGTPRRRPSRCRSPVRGRGNRAGLVRLVENRPSFTQIGGGAPHR